MSDEEVAAVFGATGQQGGGRARAIPFSLRALTWVANSPNTLHGWGAAERGKQRDGRSSRAGSRCARREVALRDGAFHQSLARMADSGLSQNTF
ncbi:hypothetical protein [Streptomyces sp. NPDC001070]